MLFRHRPTRRIRAQAGRSKPTPHPLSRLRRRPRRRVLQPRRKLRRGTARFLLRRSQHVRADTGHPARAARGRHRLSGQAPRLGPARRRSPAHARRAANTAIECGGANVIATRSRRAHPNETVPDAIDGAIPAGGGEPPDRSPSPRQGSRKSSFRFGPHRPGSAVHRSCHAVPSCPQEPSLVETTSERHIPGGGFTSRSWRFEDSMETGEMES